MTKRFLIALAIFALALGTAHAQIGGTPGISGPLANPTLVGVIDATGGVFAGATPLCFEGVTPDGFETCFAITDPAGADKTITFPNLSGTVLLGLASQSLGGTNATVTLNLVDDDTANNFLTFQDVGTAGNVITFQQDVNGPGWQVSTTDATTTNTLVQNENAFRVYSTGNLNAAFDLNLQDDDTSSVFLTFTDVGTATNNIQFQQTVNTPAARTTVTNATGTSYVDIDGSNFASITLNSVDSGSTGNFAVSGHSGSVSGSGTDGTTTGSFGFNSAGATIGWQSATAAQALTLDVSGLLYSMTTPTNASARLELWDDDTAQAFLTFTDVGTPANIITFTQDVNTPSLTFSVASGGGTGVFSLTNAAGVFGGAAANDTITIQPAAAGGAAVGFIMTTSDITGAAKTVTWADASGTPVLSSVANNAAGNAQSVTMGANSVVFEGTTGADGFELTMQLQGDPTADQTITIPLATGGLALDMGLPILIPDDTNGGTPAAYTLDPARGWSSALLTCNDPQGCTVTMGETNAVVGRVLIVQQLAAGAGNVTLVDDDGTTCDLNPDANLVFATNSSVTLLYTGAEWIQTAVATIP